MGLSDLSTERTRGTATATAADLYAGGDAGGGGAERRIQPRTALVARATIIPCSDRLGRKPITVEIRDLSSGGVGLVHTAALPQGEQFILLTPLQQGREAQAIVCTVMHCRPSGGGKFFIGAMFRGVVKRGADKKAEPSAPVVTAAGLSVNELVAAFRKHAERLLAPEELAMLQRIEQRIASAAAAAPPAATSAPAAAKPVVAVGQAPVPSLVIAAAAPPAAPPAAPAAPVAGVATASSPPPRSSTAEPVRSLLTRDQCIERAEHSLQARTLSGVVAQVISTAASPRTDLSDLVSLISRDPILSARILQAANSVGYASTRGIVATLPEAVRNIGCATVRDIAAALGVFDAMPASEADGFNPIRCWQHSFAVATICNRLAPEAEGGTAYLVGLCHDLGEIFFHSHYATEYHQVVEAQQATGKRRDELERIMMGMTHGELVQTILRCLGLPEAIRQPIAAFHEAGTARVATGSLARLLQIADLYATGVLLAASGQSPLRPFTRPECRTAFGQEEPAAIDAATLRGEIYALTAILARLSPRDEAELMKPPYAHKPARVWLARDASLSPFDPVAAALDSMADVTIREALPAPAEIAGYQGLVIAARNTSAAGFTGLDVKKAATRPDGTAVPILWLAGRIDGGGTANPGQAIPTLWPVPLAHVADFVAQL